MKKILVLRNSQAAGLIPTDQLPLLITDDKLKDLIDGEQDPFYCSVAIPLTNGGVEGTGIGADTATYTPSYFQSVFDGIKARNTPLAGSKTSGDGHVDQSVDFFTVGGGVIDNNAYFKLYIPQQGYATPNTGLIRAIKGGAQQFSIVASVEPRMENGQVFFDKELDLPRFDAVSQGAMEQVVYNSKYERDIMALIKKGAVDMKSESDELVKNGKVYRRAAVKLQSNSEQKGLAGRVLNAIAKTKHRRLNGMIKQYFNADGEATPLDPQDAIDLITNLIKAGQLNPTEAVTKLGLQDQLKTNADVDAAKLQSDILALLKSAGVEIADDAATTDIVEAVQQALADNAAQADEVVQAAANEDGGQAEVKNADGTKTENALHTYALNCYKGKRGVQLKNAREAFKSDPVAVALRSQQAAGIMVLQNSMAGIKILEV